MIQSGTTTYADMYYFEEEIARGDEGGRAFAACSAQTIIQFPVPDAKTPAKGWRGPSAFMQGVRRATI